MSDGDIGDDIGTVRWFGESWGAPVCDPRAHVATPLGWQCAGHDHMHEHRSALIEDGDQGVTLPYYHAAVTMLAYHLDCWLHEVGVDRL
jgi:hypothetical protein